MSDLDYEAQYNNRRRVPEHVDITARWAAASQDYRGKAGARLDLAYGPGERHRYDLFPAAAAAAPVLVYIHGGYWQRGDRRDFAFVARELNAAGLTVVLPSYSLCPAVGVMDIVGELRHLPRGAVAAGEDPSAPGRPFRRRALDGCAAGQRLERDQWCAARPGPGRLCHQRGFRFAAVGRHLAQ